MKKRKILVLIIVFICFTAGFAAAQDETPFLEQLKLKLQEQDWERAEIQNMLQECRKLSWEGLDPSHAEIPALALQYGKKEAEQMNAGEKAVIAHQIAVQSKEMKRSGLDRKEIAGVVMKSTREMFRNMNQNRIMYENDSSGDKIRECVQEAVRKQLRLVTAEKIKAEDGAGNGTGYGKNISEPGKKGLKQ